MICSFSLLLAWVVLVAWVVWWVYILIKIPINFIDHIGWVMYPNKVVQYCQCTDQLGLGLNGMLLGQEQDLETPLNDSKDLLDYIPELCMMEVEQLSMVLRSPHIG
jgi:hypothetical protein